MGINLSLSFSKYNTFEKCPLKYIQNYIIKPVLPEEPATYPLIMGTLTHLFIHLYHDKKMSLNNIRLLSDNLEKLYEHISLEYLSYDFKTDTYASMSMDITSKTEETIRFISNQKVVFFQAYKLFKNYVTELLPKFENDNIVSEFTFNNLYNLEDNIICMYGSIDLIFWKVYKYLYLSDFKTGKSIDIHAISQLYFYFYNLYNYNFENNITNNPDKIDKIKTIRDLLVNNIATYGLVFKLRDLTNKKIHITNVDENYTKFIEGLYNNLTNEIIPLHKNKDNILKDTSLSIYKEKYKHINYTNKDDCPSEMESYICRYCKFKELCKFRIKEIKK